MEGKVWDTILKVIITVASEVLEVFGGNTMNL
ncbi:smalltalk protein [Bacteroides sp.]|nr:smalltalk protein [Bacteroides sp.]MDD3039391.1 smalltalk protein [Bacteroides sp.]